jgi:murein DD-endopeptidase MepM/ murein hydrolase activator NlpD
MKELVNTLAVQTGVSSGQRPNALNLASSPTSRKPQDETYDRQKVAEEFASLLLFEMLKAMRATVPQSGFFTQDSAAKEIYTSLADIEVTRALAKRDSLGLGEFILQGMDKHGRGKEESAKLTDSPTSLSSVPSSASASFSPVPSGRVSSTFGLREDPVNGEERFHKGMDIAAPIGTPVRAVAAGKVVFSGQAGEYGNLVTVEHADGIITRYAHTAENLVSMGEQVAVGQKIALVGSSGRSTGPHLHFEVLKAGNPVNPQPFLLSKRL